MPSLPRPDQKRAELEVVVSTVSAERIDANVIAEDAAGHPVLNKHLLHPRFISHVCELPREINPDRHIRFNIRGWMTKSGGEGVSLVCSNFCAPPTWL